MKRDQSPYHLHEGDKAEPFRANQKLNALLDELREHLMPVQERLGDRFEAPRWPVSLVVGNPRSGTTLLLQFLASTGAFAYSTNVMTRFAYAPYIGALIQQMLFCPEYDFHGDFSDIQSSVNFDSNQGKSKGALAVNEFQHFFRCYLPHFDPLTLSREECAAVDTRRMRRDLASIEWALGKPFATKGFMLQFNLGYFHEAIPELFVVHVQRESLFVMQSLLLAREEYYGSRDIWYSVKPRQYDRLKTMDVHHQIAGQVYFTERAIGEGLAAIPSAHQLTVRYESLCSDPRGLYDHIVEKYAQLGCELDRSYRGPGTFVRRDTLRLPENEVAALCAAYDDFACGKISLEE